jgi:glycosyltransferase involved in cell wall biosynthesis
MRILLSNEARSGGGGVESYLAAVGPALRAAGHEVALLYANTAAEQGPTDVATERAWSVRDLGLETAVAAAQAWRPDVCFAHNMRYLDIEETIAGTWPTVKMMHAYAGACLSGHKAFSFPSVEPCGRACGAGCLAYFLPRRCGRLRPDVMVQQYAHARRQQAIFPRYRAMVVASEHMRREFARYAGLASRITTIPLFAGAPAVAAAVEPAGAQAGAPAGAARDLDVTFLGRLTPLKGADLLIDALADAGRALKRPARALVAGEGPLRAAMTEKAGLDGLVEAELPGWIDAAARDAALARTKVLALPSRWPEPFGLVGLEAARFGVPAVAFDVGGIRSWLEDGVNGVLVPSSGGARAFGAALAALLGDTPRLAALSAGAAALPARFSCAAHVSALEQVLRSAARAGSRSSSPA